MTQTRTLPGELFDRTHRQATLDTTVPLAGMAPGAYTLTVMATLAGGESATHQVPFEIR